MPKPLEFSVMAYRLLGMQSAFILQPLWEIAFCSASIQNPFDEYRHKFCLVQKGKENLRKECDERI
jgi:hypothetical protein